MSPVMTVLGFGFQFFAVAIWCGGLLYFAAVVAPLAFHKLRSRTEAGNFTAACLRRFHTWEAACALLSLCGSGFLYVAPVQSWLLWVDVGIALAMFLLFIVCVGLLMPRLDALRMTIGDADMAGRDVEPKVLQTFHQLHAWYARLSTVNIALGVVLLAVLILLAIHCGEGTATAVSDTLMLGGSVNQWP
jgi:uncharacterized membrane protein